jgi:hypothetical protein
LQDKHKVTSNLITKKFETPRQFVEWATHAPCLWSGNLSSRKTENEASPWSGSRTYEEAYDLALSGWPEGIQKLAKQMDLTIPPAPPSRTPKKLYDVAGYYPHAGRAAAGELLSMVNPKRADRGAKPIIKIKYNLSANASTSPNKIITFGSALCSYINRLELQRSSLVILNACEESFGRNGLGVSFQFPLKNPGFPLSLADMVYWMAHPSALRRICFSALERLDVQHSFGFGYGTPADITSAEDELRFSPMDASGSFDQDLKNIQASHMKMATRPQGSANTGQKSGRSLTF